MWNAYCYTTVSIVVRATADVATGRGRSRQGKHHLAIGRFGQAVAQRIKVVRHADPRCTVPHPKPATATHL